MSHSLVDRAAAALRSRPHDVSILGVHGDAKEHSPISSVGSRALVLDLVARTTST